MRDQLKQEPAPRPLNYYAPTTPKKKWRLLTLALTAWAYWMAITFLLFIGLVILYVARIVFNQ